jgi:hydroxypyruvate reductase
MRMCAQASGRPARWALRPSGALVNVARSIVYEPALVAALREGRLGGAALDVFEDEPDVPEALLGMQNVVLTPHIASATNETKRAMGDLMIDNLDAFFAGRTMPTPMTERFDRPGRPWPM